MGFRFSFTGGSDMARKIAQAHDELKRRHAHAVKMKADQILSDAQLRVPVDTGELRDSGHVEMVSDGEARIVFDAPYAVAVHEDLEASHRHGQARFLAGAIEEAEPTILADLAATIDLNKS